MSDVASYHHFTSRIKWDTPPHSQVGVDPGNNQIQINVPSLFRTLFITRYAGKVAGVKKTKMQV